jgi:hypothetical protein
MPIYMDVSRMNRLVVIVAKGHVTAEEVAANTRALVEADVPWPPLQAVSRAAR